MKSGRVGDAASRNVFPAVQQQRAAEPYGPADRGSRCSPQPLTAALGGSSAPRRGMVVKPRIAWTSRVRACVFLALVLLTAEASAQQPSKVPQIGYLGYGAPADALNRVRALRIGLRDHGYVEARTLTLYFDGLRRPNGCPNWRPTWSV
jgi:hypothetical protein